jgi:hypothetical protein
MGGLETSGKMTKKRHRKSKLSNNAFMRRGEVEVSYFHVNVLVYGTPQNYCKLIWQDESCHQDECV